MITRSADSIAASELAAPGLAALGCPIDVRLNGSAQFGRDGAGFAGRDLSEAIGGLAWETNREGYRLGVRLSHYESF
jgi:hypothetical protein